MRDRCKKIEISRSEKVRHKFTQKQKLALTIVTIVDLLSFCSISFMSLFLPQDAAKLGETFEVLNVSFKFSVLTTTLTALFFGITLPKFGVKNIFLGAVIFSRLGTFLFGTLHYVENVNVFTFLSYLLRGVEAMGETGYVIAGYVIIFSTFPEDVGIIRGLVEAIVGIGTTIGPPVGELIFSIGGYGLPFYFVGMFVISIAVAGAQVLDDPRDGAENLQSFKDFIKIPIVMLTSATVALVSLTTSALDPTLRDHVSIALPHIRTGHVFLLIAATFALSSPLWGYLSEKVTGFEWMIPTGLYLNGICLLFVEPDSFMDSLAFPTVDRMIVIGILGIAMSLSLVPTFRCLTMGALEKGFKYTLTTHTYVISTWTFWFAVGEILGPNIGQILYKKYDFALTAFVIAALNVGLAALFTIFLYCKAKNRNLFCTFNVTIYIQ